MSEKTPTSKNTRTPAIEPLSSTPDAAELSDTEAQAVRDGGATATGGAGAGKIKFNEFTIKKTSD